MVKMYELTPKERTSLVNDISLIMDKHYHIDYESIDKFWETVAIGTQAREVS